MCSSSGKAVWQKRYRALGGPAGFDLTGGWALGIDGGYSSSSCNCGFDETRLELYEPHAKGLLGLRIQRPVRIHLHWASPRRLAPQFLGK